MRISDWSSDVCSSDLRQGRRRIQHDGGGRREVQRIRTGPHGNPYQLAAGRGYRVGQAALLVAHQQQRRRAAADRLRPLDRPEVGADGAAAPVLVPGEVARRVDTDQRRSEEHTSELQSLMRISYAVLCLKKKKRKKI